MCRGKFFYEKKIQRQNYFSLIKVHLFSHILFIVDSSLKSSYQLNTGKLRRMRKVARISIQWTRNSIKTLSMTPRRNLAHGIIRGACVACSRQSLIIDHHIAAYESSFLRDYANLMTPRFLRDIQMALLRTILTF